MPAVRAGPRRGETIREPRATYRAAAERHGAAVAGLERTIGRLEAARLATFVVAAVLGLLRNDLPVTPIVPTVGSVVFFSIFVALVVRHRRLRRILRRERAAHALARLGLLRLARDWRGLHAVLDDFGHRDPLLQPEAASDESHPYLQDLDLFGPASVRALMGPTPSATGSRTLREWLLSPASIDDVRDRQVAVRALAADPEGRDSLAIEGLLVDRVDRAEWEAFLEWLDRPPLFGRRGGDRPVAEPFGAALPAWSVTVARVLPPITLTVFVAWVAGAGVPVATWVVPLVVQGGLAWRWGNALAPYFDRATSKSPGLRRHHPLFAAWEDYDLPEIAAVRARLTAGSQMRASEEIRRLERWLDAADSRASMLHLVFAGALFWDVHVGAGLERWRGRAGGEVRGWFDALGELEALSALATLAHDQPEWCVPELRDGAPGLGAEALGHPLLPDAERRTSDVRLDPPGRFLLVTGSNMSGKSTLLRSIGLAAVLGQMGSVVCARRAELTPLRTFTSMRVHDSLTEGVSLFMAELLRLKALVDAADEGAEGTALLYLIDEVLQGTNSEERRVAARRILTHLLSTNAIGAVTTHDLALHEEPGLDRASTKVHFRETVEEDGEQVLSFDYRLRPGLATSRNALKLLRIVGLDDADDD